MIRSGIADALNELFRTLLVLPQQASTYARSIDTLHYVEMTSMVGLTAIVVVVVIRFCIRYRRRADNLRTPRIVAPLWLELPVYGGITVFFLALWVVGFWQFVGLERTPPGALDIYVTGKQWMWKFAYPQESTGSVGVLYAPAGRPVRLLLTSRDVIHSFYVPDFRLKRDAVPGMYTATWFEAPEPGRHQIECAELCGVGHSRMRGEIVVLRADAWESWVVNQRAVAETTGAPPDLRSLGERAAADHGCLTCHATAGSPVNGLGPSWVGLYGSEVKLSDGREVLADESYLTRSMMDPALDIVAGYPPVMPSYQGLISAPETAEVVEYIKSLARPVGASSARGER